MSELKDVPLSVAKAHGCGPFSAPFENTESLRLSIFERIRAEGAVSRAKIAKDLGISPATVTTQTSALIEMGFILEKPAEIDPSEAGRGRPPIALGVRPRAHLVAGLKLSDSKHTAVICDFAGNQVASTTVPATDQSEPKSVVEMTACLVRAVCQAAKIELRDLSAVGVGLPGFIEAKSGLVHWSPIIAGQQLEFANLMSERLGLPVAIDNDANLVALAESWFGVGRQISDFAVVTIEHGVGMGLVVNHKVYRGARGMGMELGHTKVAMDGALCRCGQRGCLEAYIADYALVREAGVATGSVNTDPSIQAVLEDLYVGAKKGNLAARSIFERAGKYLALGMGNVLNLFDPQLLILSGGRMRYDYLYSDEILEEMKRYALASGVALPPVEINAWGDLVWASGAAALALSHVTESHLSAKTQAAG